MLGKTVGRVWKVVRHDPRNLLHPVRRPRLLASGVMLFNGNRLLRHPSSRIEIEGGRLQFGCFWDCWDRRGGIVLHENATLRVRGDVVLGDGVLVEVHRDALLEIGGGTFINPDSRVIVLESVRIGRDCAIAWDVQIMDGDRHFFLDRQGARVRNTAPIVLGDHVWVGARSLVLKGASVGDGAVVGAGAVVTGEVGASTVVAGNPARVIREGVQWEK